MAELLTFFIILAAGLFFSDIFKRLHLPYVSALIFAGIIAGPFALNLVQIDSTFEFLAAIGVVFLMFIAGSEIKTRNFADIKDKVLILATFNGLIPFAVGFGIGNYFGFDMITSLILGTIFISSSVGVIIPSLESRGLLTTNLGKTIISATVIEDIGSLVLLSFVLQKSDLTTFIPLYLYIPLLILVIFVLKSIIPRLEKSYHKGKTGKDLFESELRFVFGVLLASIVLFELLGMHALIAGFITGMSLSGSLKGKIYQKIRTLSYGLFIPVFFFIIGVQMDISVFFNPETIVLVSILVLSSMGSKFASGWAGGRFAGFSNRSSVFIGVSTMPQLSTSLAVAFAALEFGLLTPELISAIITLSIFSTLVTPFLMTLAYRNCTEKDLA